VEARQSGFLDSILAALVRPIISYLARPSTPTYRGRVSIPGLRTKVDVSWNAHGVPHVFAADEKDLFLAQGFLHAQERLWQMDMTRRFLAGRLAEVFGSLSLPWREISSEFRQRTIADFDYFIRLIGIRRAALASLDVLADQDHLRLDAYSEGVNRYIEQCGKQLPWEFRLLRYQPDPWRPEDSLAIAKGMAFFLSTALFTRLGMIALAAKLDGDRAKLRALYPSYPENGPTVIRTVWGSTRSVWQFTNGTFAQTDWHPAGHGSNNWVIAPSRSETGGAILCNDPHLRTTLPGFWYLMHLKAAPIETQPAGYEVWGASIPGSPCIHVGHNRWIAWGVTAAVCDDVELYREKVHRLDPNLYLAGERWQAMKNHWETIRVRGTGDIQRNVRLTRHGPVISDFDPSTRESAEVIAFRWTAHAPSKEFRCLYGVNCARDWRDFLDSLSDQSAPTLSYVYADQQGNIGYTLAGKIPLRSQAPSLLPVEGWRASDDWRGYIPFNELPRLYNPPEGVIASANNKIGDSSYPYYLSLFYEPPFRIRRIQELLGAKKRLSLHDMATMQMDTVSLHARALIETLKMDLQSIPGDDRAVMEASDRLIRWDGRCEANSVEAAIFHVFHHRLMANLLVPVLGKELFHTYVEIFNQCVAPIDKILSAPDSLWFAAPTRRELVSRSLREACNELKQALGDNPSIWGWGKIHTLLLNHALGRLKILKPLLAVGPFPSPGDGMTLNIGFYRHSNPYDQIVGASLRMIIDVGNWEQSSFVLPAGQSGHFNSPHYRDQTVLWRGGQGISLFLDMSQKDSLRCLTLEPALT
jgi:penicillin amidase